MSPAKIRTLLETALAHHQGGRLAEAETLYLEVLAASPKNFDAMQLAGMTALQTGRYGVAVDRLRRAVKLNPGSAVCGLRLGAALFASGAATEALRHLQKATQIAPTLPEAWFHLGVVHHSCGSATEARVALEKALALRADYPEALEHLAGLVSRTDGFGAAVPILRRRVELQPGNADALANLGVALAQTMQRGQAMEFFDRVLAANPEHPQALTGRGLALQESYRLDEAVESYGRAIELQPANYEARSGRLFSLHYLDGVTRQQLQQEHMDFGISLPPAPPFSGGNVPDPVKRLRVAFLSPDLRAHSVAYFIEPLLRHLDSTQFETVLYHDHPTVDAMSERLRSRAGIWRHVASQTHSALEAIIRSDAPDLLIDLAGHTGQNRLLLFARRLAPVQVTYLGYPDTTGVREMDFRLVDAITDPEGEADDFHSETLCRFAPTAWTYSPPEAAPEPVGLPEVEAGITFGCFNNFSKVSDSTLRCWSRLLAAVPRSRLLLKWHGLSSPEVAGRLRTRLAAFSFQPDQVELIERSPNLATHLSLYGRVDVALDTYPYHGTTTTCEALWMGVPVVTLRGDRHSSRVGASLLAAAGHPEWIAATPEEYVQVAARLAADRAGRVHWRTGLRAELRQCPLFDHAGQAARLGAALREFWSHWCAERPRGAPSDQTISLSTTPVQPNNCHVHDLRPVTA